MSPDRILEVKRDLDGSARRYECELVELDRGRVVVLFRFDRDGQPVDSYGVFWRRRPYNCYYALPAGGLEQDLAPLFVRFDVVRDVEFALGVTPSEVRYVDLLLDLWVDGAGARWEDEDELDEAVASGHVSEIDRHAIEAARAILMARHTRIASEVRALLRGLTLTPR